MKYIVKQCSGRPNQIVDIPDNAKHVSVNVYTCTIRWLEEATHDDIAGHVKQENTNHIDFMAVALFLCMLGMFVLAYAMWRML